MARYTHFKVWLPREPTIPRSQDRSRPFMVARPESR